MKRVTKPVYILLFVTLPQLMLFCYLTLRPGVNIESIALSGTIILLLMGIFSIYALIKRREYSTDTRVFTAISAVYALFTALMLLFNEELFNIAGLLSPRLVFIILCMIPVLYGIYGTAFNTTSAEQSNDTAGYAAGLIAVPFIWFVMMNIINGINLNAILMISIIAGVYTITLLSVKMLLVWKQEKPDCEFNSPSTKRYYIITTFVSLLLPLGGLAINQGNEGLWSRADSVGMFGDFSSPAFYIIAALNGFLMLLPAVKDKKLRLLVFYLKAVCYTYILYFFIVFLPILPIGAIGLIFYGLGIFILAPALAAIWQGWHIIKEWAGLSKAWGTPRIIAVFCAGIITLPVCMISTFWSDKDNFAAAVRYLDHNSVEVTKTIDLARLDRTLKNVKGSYDLTRGITGYAPGNTPIISAFYTDFVLDEKVISQHNILALENLFFDSGHSLIDAGLSNSNMVNNRVRLAAVKSKTEFAEETGVYRSWVDLTLENPTGEGNGEYVTTFKLPEGAYISDYYLDVSGDRKEGILTDRRAAMFIYRKIVNTRRDPGLLYYTGRNTLELRVFPFSEHEVRQTGFEILHNHPLNINLDNNIIALGKDVAQKETAVEGAVLLSPLQKAGLKRVERTPEYHFVIDCSKNSDIAWHIEQIEEYATANKITGAEVIFASQRVESHSLADMKKAKFKTECGFNFDRAVRMILSKESSKSFPVIIAVSDNMPGAVFPGNIYPLSDRFPESPFYYALNHDLTLTPYSYEDNKAGSRLNDPIVEPVLDFNGKYISDNDECELVLGDMEPDSITLTGNRYKDAILLDAAQQRYLVNGKPNPLELIRAGFRARILTPQTAFIVVETPEQEKELLDLQERILNNNEQIPTVTLDEPPLLLCATLVLLVILFIKKRKSDP
ncbi:MAG: MSEP-CTERM sorting domain-containing protein [Desulfotomaculaceae bacterium]|nr:MSEP-CTERM sorting domain-containing protein [Desulfotomaculaceae bacterium]